MNAVNTCFEFLYGTKPTKFSSNPSYLMVGLNIGLPVKNIEARLNSIKLNLNANKSKLPTKAIESKEINKTKGQLRNERRIERAKKTNEIYSTAKPKTCSACQKLKQPNEFYLRACHTTKLDPICKVCRKEKYGKKTI